MRVLKETSLQQTEWAVTLRTEFKSKQAETRFISRLQESQIALLGQLARGYDHWIITFSGGKDSTTSLVVVLETALTIWKKIRRIDIVYADTLVEIPVIRESALNFLRYLKASPRLAKLPLYYHVVYPAVEQRFWVCLLGKGYPPPHQRFRWCTRRLKIEPAEKALKAFTQPDQTMIITGVRFGESINRDVILNNSCKRGGECGQGAWFQYSHRLKAGYFAPIAYWQECDVWDFLNFYAPSLGYPTAHLETDVYNGRETRFGCWVCTVVRQDRAMKKITELRKWQHLRPLLEFRNRIVRMTSSPQSRYRRPDGNVGRLTLCVRGTLLNELLGLQESLGLTLITQPEIRLIRNFWKQPKYQDYPKGGGYD